MSSPRFKPADPVDFLVIGAGAAGGVMAKALSVAGFRVVVLEQGPYLREKDYSHDEIKYTFQPGLTNDPKVQPITFRETESAPAKPLKAIEYGKQVGDGSVHFTENYWRFHESDFRGRTLFGDIPGSAFADWPNSDSEPYYTKAECDLAYRVSPERIPLKARGRNSILCRRCRSSRRGCCSSGPPSNSASIYSQHPWLSFLGRFPFLIPFVIVGRQPAIVTSGDAQWQQLAFRRCDHAVNHWSEFRAD